MTILYHNRVRFSTPKGGRPLDFQPQLKRFAGIVSREVVEPEPEQADTPGQGVELRKQLLPGTREVLPAVCN